MEKEKILLLLEVIAKGNAGPEPVDIFEEGESDEKHEKWEEEWTQQFEWYVSFLEDGESKKQSYGKKV